MNKRSIILIEVIIIIVLLAVVAIGILTYIAESLRFNASSINQEKALYIASAAIMQAVVDYRDDSLWESAQNVNAGGELYYHLGEDAGFLRVDASGTSLISGGTGVGSVPIGNLNAANSITITEMIVEWTFGGGITSITLAGSEVWSGAAASGGAIDIIDATIASGVVYPGASDQQWVFSASVSGDVLVTFIFSDGSQRKGFLVNNDLTGNNEFSITATGEAGGGSGVGARRTLIATYDVGTSEITSWEESQNHIIP